MNVRAVVIGAVSAVFLLAGNPVQASSTPPPPVPGDPTAGRCEGREVLLVHDLAGSAHDWDLLAADLRAAGWCPHAIDWGRPRPGDVPLPAGGLTGIEPAASSLSRAWDAADAPGGGTSTPVPVVARGVGALVVQRALQIRQASGSAADPGSADRSRTSRLPISALITLGPVWNGTNLLGIADVEDISRRLGTFDAVLAWERTWMDRICEGCREPVRGSEFLVRLHAEGVRTPGIAYTDIVSATDLLVHPPGAQSPPGTRVEVLHPRGDGLPVWHGELGRDPGSRGLVMDALART